ncbi:hypothetical protein MKZ38_006455 [Zalerion maritima]|uniref:Molybdenum cofactor sulfurase n=1 Tax=Zalerion maritima TaxID=339359 RepID=A0AAD5WTY4_9PEZI|nr:hypothetical protein MKZ38_006455 [Zalerion maritima]
MTYDPAAYNKSIESLRASEFPQLAGSTYLDHAASTIYPKSLIDGFASDMLASIYGNPHSESLASQHTSNRIDNIRLRALDFLGATPDAFDLVFVSNATAALKLVADTFRACPHGFQFTYHNDSHTSVVGIRGESQRSKCLNTPDVVDWLAGNPPVFEHEVVSDSSSSENEDDAAPPVLFAYPTQSNMCGRRHPRSWAHDVRERQSRRAKTYTLVDAAAFAATSPLRLGDAETAPDFTIVSFTKIFGFPNLAALVVRRQAAHVFSWRKYFGGGTVDMVVCFEEEWHAPKAHMLHERLEDGTLPIHNILALDTAFDVQSKLYGTMADVSAHTSFLASCLYRGLSELRHWNGIAVCAFYSRDPSQPTKDAQQQPQTNGPVVTFNVLCDTGQFISPTEFDKLATTKKIDIRTGGLCNPGGIAAALQLQPWELRRNFSSGLRCGQESDLIGGRPVGVIRASLGAMSTATDVDQFISFVDNSFRTAAPNKAEARLTAQPVDTPTNIRTSFVVEDIFIYPIKSCGGFRVPHGTVWDARLEGLAWDREWVLVHRGTGQALSQKRYPRMALLKPSIDQQRGVLRVFCDAVPDVGREEVVIPLSINPTLFKTVANEGQVSRVCGDEVKVITYSSEELNNFFSDTLGVPCELARFPPGGTGAHQRLSKASFQKHQQQPRTSCPVAAVSEERHHILLANESAMLLVNTASVDALNYQIRESGGSREVSPSSFRPNIVVGPSSRMGDSSFQELAYAEDYWSSIRIGAYHYTMAGSCRRCQMVCVDQDTGERHQEPLATLSKTRRFGGKIFFGSHMHLPKACNKIIHNAGIVVGDVVEVDLS